MGHNSSIPSRTEPGSGTGANSSSNLRTGSGSRPETNNEHGEHEQMETSTSTSTSAQGLGSGSGSSSGSGQGLRRRTMFSSLGERLRRNRDEVVDGGADVEDNQNQNDNDDWVLPTSSRRRRRTSSSDETLETERKRRQRSTLRRLTQFGSNMMSSITGNEADNNTPDQAESSQQASLNAEQQRQQHQGQPPQAVPVPIPIPGNGAEATTALLSRLLAVAASVTANSLLGGRNTNTSGGVSWGRHRDQDNSFSGFLNRLNDGLLTTELNRSTEGPNGTPQNFFRMFRFPASQATSDSPSLVPILIVGVRAVQNNGTNGRGDDNDNDNENESNNDGSEADVEDGDGDRRPTPAQNDFWSAYTSQSNQSNPSTLLDQLNNENEEEDWLQTIFRNNRAHHPHHPSRQNQNQNQNENENQNQTPNREGAAPNGRPTWIVYVVGGAYPEDHPFLRAPSLFTDEPSYEDLLTLERFLGQVKPPVATQEEVETSGGIHKIGLDFENGIDPKFHEKCLICLSKYETGEEVRQLKLCGHTFHTKCIDQWLTTGRNSCPLCRGEGVKKREEEKEKEPEQEPVSASTTYSQPEPSGF